MEGDRLILYRAAKDIVNNLTQVWTTTGIVARWSVDTNTTFLFQNPHTLLMAQMLLTRIHCLLQHVNAIYAAERLECRKWRENISKVFLYTLSRNFVKSKSTPYLQDLSNILDVKDIGELIWIATSVMTFFYVWSKRDLLLCSQLFQYLMRLIYQNDKLMNRKRSVINLDNIHWKLWWD